MTFSCLLCRYDRGRPIVRKAPLLLSLCRHCGFVQQDPLPAQEEYESRYRHAVSYAHDLLRDKHLFFRRDTRVLAMLARRGASGPLLDVGAGPGILMEAAHARAWAPIGLELAQASADYIRQELRLEVHQVPIERAPFAPGSFGVITFSHSLEHLLDPLAALRYAGRFLRRDGLLHIAVPNWLAAKRFLAGKQIAWIGTEHISYFTSTTLRQALRLAGFAIVDCRTLPMVCDVDYQFAVTVLERFGLDRIVRRFLSLGEQRLGVLLGDNIQVSCPPWRFRAVVKSTRALLHAWPEWVFGLFGYGEELRVTAKLSPVRK